MSAHREAKIWLNWVLHLASAHCKFPLQNSWHLHFLLQAYSPFYLDESCTNCWSDHSPTQSKFLKTVDAKFIPLHNHILFPLLYQSALFFQNGFLNPFFNFISIFSFSISVYFCNGLLLFIHFHSWQCINLFPQSIDLVNDNEFLNKSNLSK